MKIHVIVLSILVKCSLCRDYYVGMKKKNDILVAQDTLYKEKNYFGVTTAKYGRIFQCPITYFRVSDRLGVGRPPSVIVTRGGLRKKYITLLLTSSYDMPIAVNIYVGCEKKTSQATTTTFAASTKTSTTDSNIDMIEDETTTDAIESENVEETTLENDQNNDEENNEQDNAENHDENNNENNKENNENEADAEAGGERQGPEEEVSIVRNHEDIDHKYHNNNYYNNYYSNNYYNNYNKKRNYIPRRTADRTIL